jgi:DNA-binding LytR/AlgR family response regulator
MTNIQGKYISAILIDDDPSARNILEKFLETEGDVQILAKLENTQKAIESIEKFKPTVVFLDINMPEEDGIHFATRLRKTGIDVLLVFTTAFCNYALDAFPLKPFDFLVKPFGPEEVMRVINNIESLKKKENVSIWSAGNIGKLKLRISRGFIFIKPIEILYVKSTGNTCELITFTGETIKLHSTLSETVESANHSNLIRINRGVAINFEHITRIERKMKKCMLTQNGNEISFPLTQKSLLYLERMNSLKLG